MNNLTAREKGFMYVITLLIIVVLGYFFGVRTLNNKYEEYKQQLAALEQRKAYLDQMAAFFNQKYGEGRVEVKHHDVYFNMLEKIEDGNMYVVKSSLAFVYCKEDIVMLL